MKRFLTTCLLTALAAAAVAAPKLAPAPAFKVIDLRGDTWTQRGPAQGCELVDFWASWCLPCLKEIPALNALEARYAPAHKLWVLGLSLDKGGEAAVKAAALKFKVAYDVAPVDPKVAEAYQVQGFPSAFLIKNGKVVLPLTGARDLAAFERDLAPYLR